MVSSLSWLDKEFVSIPWINRLQDLIFLTERCCPVEAGAIPKELSSLTQLQELYLWRNELTGECLPSGAV